jgi:hypothetical protein
VSSVILVAFFLQPSRCCVFIIQDDGRRTSCYYPALGRGFLANAKGKRHNVFAKQLEFLALFGSDICLSYTNNPLYRSLVYTVSAMAPLAYQHGIC